MLSVYTRNIDNNITIRDEEALEKYVKLIQWGRRNPVQFIERIFQIPLMDYQKWLIAMTWNAEYAVWVCSRNAGKSFLLGCIAPARALLYPKSKIHIMSTGSRQANETFETMEDVVKHRVKSLISDNTVFWDELEKSKSDSDGFTHDPKKGNKCGVLNGSFIRAVCGSAKTVRGKRSNTNIYDEAGTIPRDFYDATEPFVTQSADFKTGSAYDADVYPQEVPNLRLYVGSATDTNSLFWDKYREAAKQMIAGNDKYFVADLNCEIPLHPKMNGIAVKPLLSQEEVDRKMRENEIIAMREYYNIFDRFDLEDSVVTRSDIYLNTEDFLPQLSWGGKKHKYVISFDPASKNDNSPVLITEIFKNEEGIWQGRFVHMENLVVTYGDGSRRPMRLEEQTNRLRDIVYEFNGRDNIAPYDNIMLLIDAGTGGQAPAIVQELCKDWTDSHGQIHPGLYDENSEDMKRWSETFPHAIPGRMKLLEPTKYRNAFFEAAKNLVASGNIKFPPACPKFDTLVLDDGTERKLSKAEQASLVQMDLMKEEMVSMIRVRGATNSSVRYGLPPEKKNKMNDDRNYVAIMACWWVNQVRIDETLGEEVTLDYMGKFIQPSINRSNDNSTRAISDISSSEGAWANLLRGGTSGKRVGTSPFSGSNPFGKK